MKAAEVLLCFVELEQAEKVVVSEAENTAELILYEYKLLSSSLNTQEHVVAKGLAHKVPKVVAASVDFLLQSVR